MDDDTEGKAEIVTLHVDLVWTDLEDFVEHLEEAVRGPRLDPNSDMPTTPFTAGHWLLGDVAGYRLLWGDEPIEYPPRWAGLEHLDTGRYIRIYPWRRGNIEVVYSAAGMHSATGWFSLSATRFRRDRLRITLWELQGSGGAHAERLRAWLIRNWGEDGVREKKLEDAPPRLEPPLVIEAEDALKVALRAIQPRPSTPEWWAAVAKLFDAHRRANPKYTYAGLADRLGMEEKHVGRMVRKYRPKTP